MQPKSARLTGWKGREALSNPDGRFEAVHRSAEGEGWPGEPASDRGTRARTEVAWRRLGMKTTRKPEVDTTRFVPPRAASPQGDLFAG